MLFGEVKCTHWPILVTFECSCWVTVAVLHSVADVAFKKIEHFKELFTNFINVCLFILLVLFSYLFKSVVRTELDLLRIVNGFLLTYWSIKVDMFLFESAHG